MASSGVYTYQPTAYSIIQGAGRLVSAIQTGETLPDDEYSDLLYALNGLVGAWQASGIHLWAELDATLFLQPNQVSYQIGDGSPDRCCASNSWLQVASTALAPASATSIAVSAVSGNSPLNGPTLSIAAGNHVGIWLDNGTTFWTTVSGAPSGLVVPLTNALPSQASSGAQVVAYAADMVRPLKVPAARRFIYASPGGQPIRTPMSIYSRLDYYAVPNPTTPGTPTAFYFDPQLGYAVMNVWPAPSNNQNAVQFTVQRPLQDFIDQANSADLPIEWSSALRFALAVEIAPEYDVPADRFQILQSMAGQKFADVATWDREVESVYFGVEAMPSTRN